MLCVCFFATHIDLSFAVCFQIWEKHYLEMLKRNQSSPSNGRLHLMNWSMIRSTFYGASPNYFPWSCFKTWSCFSWNARGRTGTSESFRYVKHEIQERTLSNIQYSVCGHERYLSFYLVYFRISSNMLLDNVYPSLQITILKFLIPKSLYRFSFHG